MALSGTVVWEVQSGGNDANGGGFNSADSGTGTDYSTSTSPHVTIDGATITATVHTTTTQLNIVGYTVATTDKGNLVKITGGSMTAGTYQITNTDTVNNRWTIDRSGGTAAQTGTGRMGGCKATWGEISTLLVNDNIMYVKAATYTYTTTTVGAAGPLQIPNNVRCRILGYTSSRTDGGSATMSCGSVSPTLGMIQQAGSNAAAHIENIILDGNSQSTALGTSLGGRNHLYNCWAKNGLTGFSGGHLCTKCYASGNSSNGFSGVNCAACTASGNAIGFSLQTAGVFAADCIAYSNTNDGYNLSSGGSAYQCLAYGNTNDGFDLTVGTVGAQLAGCISTGNSGYQFNTGANTGARMIGCAYKNDGLGTINGTPTINLSPITLTADPFANAGSQDFKLNNTAGGGAAVRALGMAPYGQTSYRDVGPDQHQEAAAGGLISQRGFTGGVPA